MQPAPLRVLVVDDSAVMRRAITRIIEDDHGLSLVGVARNGREALERINALHPDVVTLDIEMPEMTGLRALTRMRFDCAEPLPAVIMCSSLTAEGSHDALKALRLGAADVIGKDPGAVGKGDAAFARELRAKIHAIGETRRQQHPSTTSNPPTTAVRAPRPAPSRPAVEHAGARGSAGAPGERGHHRRLRLDPGTLDLVLVGSSTGGPPALEELLTPLPADLSVPIVIAQHMPALFTRCLTERLDRHSALTVRHADRGIERLLPGVVYLIVGGRHGRIVSARGGGWGLSLGDEPAEALYKPSVDVLFESASSVGERALGVVLTGMGEDGVVGAASMARAGGRLVAQSGESCVVYGMPKAIADAGLAEASLAPEAIGRALAALQGGPAGVSEVA